MATHTAEALMQTWGCAKLLRVASPSDESTEQLLAAFRRRIDAKIQSDLGEEERAAEALRQQVLTTLRAEIAEARRQGLSARIWLFGSYAWGRPGPASDVDLLGEGDEVWVAGVVGRSTGREVHAIRIDEAPPSLVERVVEEGILL